MNKYKALYQADHGEIEISEESLNKMEKAEIIGYTLEFLANANHWRERFSETLMRLGTERGSR